MYSDYCYGKIPGVTFENSVDELAKTYRDAYSKDLHFAIGGPFKLSALKKKLDEEWNNAWNDIQAYFGWEDGTYADFLETELSKYLDNNSSLVTAITNNTKWLETNLDALKKIAEKLITEWDDIDGRVIELETKYDKDGNIEQTTEKGKSKNDLAEWQLDLVNQWQKTLDNPRAGWNNNDATKEKYVQNLLDRYPWLEESMLHYKSGGLSTSTGPAWLDGTPSRPEYILNADQTEAFLKLASVLPSVIKGNMANNVKSAENIYLNLTMNIDEIGSDYDVDQIAERVKDIIYEASAYRNVNVLDFNI